MNSPSVGKASLRKHAALAAAGATLEGMKVLDERQVDGIMAEVAEACVKRAYELGK